MESHPLQRGGKERFSIKYRVQNREVHEDNLALHLVEERIRFAQNALAGSGTDIVSDVIHLETHVEGAPVGAECT